MLMIMDFQGQKSLEIILAEFSASSLQKFKPGTATATGVKRDQGNWFTDTESGPRALTWLDHAEHFDGYNTAFIYASWGYYDSSFSAYLEDGFINGYRAGSLLPRSPFAAYSVNGGTISVETSAFPILGAVWLLGSGLLGIFAVRRRK